MIWVRLAVSAVAILFTAVSAAAPEELKEFRSECPRGSYLTGFEGRAGAWVDTIQIVCARWNAEQQKLDPPKTQDFKHGRSQGGHPTQALCDSGSVVAGHYVHDTALWGGRGRLLHHIDFDCHAARGNGELQPRSFGSQSPITKPRPVGGQCRDGEFATGIRGWHATFVYLDSLICRRAPVLPADLPVVLTKPVGRAAERDTGVVSAPPDDDRHISRDNVTAPPADDTHVAPDSGVVTSRRKGPYVGDDQ
jgi:hypothetical protein